MGDEKLLENDVVSGSAENLDTVLMGYMDDDMTDENADPFNPVIDENDPKYIEAMQFAENYQPSDDDYPAEGYFEDDYFDGFSDNEGVIILAATNRPDVLDKALLRAGRFDRQIVVGSPDVKAREQILEVHARKKKLAEDVDLRVIAKNTSGFAGADLENVLNEAALLAARRNYKEIGMKEIEDAMVKVTMGPEKKTRVRSEKENRLVAYHEAGHAVVSRYLPTQDPVHQISIVPRGMAGGYTMYRPTEDKSFMSKTEMEENIVSLLGGRVAEALILNDISTGASNDIERASQIARNMVTKYGMSDRVGAIMFGGGQGEVFLGRDFAQTKDYSEETANIIDEEVKKIVDRAYNRAVEILSAHVDKLHAVAGVLLEKEKIEGEEFDKIFEE